MKTQTQILDCQQCGAKASINYVLKEDENYITITVCKCKHCKYQYGIKELFNVLDVIKESNKMFDDNGWNHLHDVALDAIGKNYHTRKSLFMLYEALPEQIKLNAVKYGLSDTVVRDEIFIYLKEAFN